jgi:hypothetical protein
MSRAHGTIAIQERQGIFRGISIQRLIYNTGRCGQGIQRAFLRPPPRAPPLAPPHPLPAAPPRYGSSYAPGARQSAVFTGWTGRSGWDRGGPVGVPWGALGKADGCGGLDSNWISNAQRCETHFYCAHVAYEATREVAGLGGPVECCLARMSRGNGRWNGGGLEMTQDTRDHWFLGQSGNDAECTGPVKGTGSDIQVKHPPQFCPTLVRCPRVGLMPIHTLSAWCRRDRAAQAAVQRQTAPILHQMDARKRYQRHQLLQEFQRCKCNAGRLVRARFCERVHSVGGSPAQPSPAKEDCSPHRGHWGWAMCRPRCYARLHHGQSARHMADQTASRQQAGEAAPLAAAGPGAVATKNF